LYKKYPPTFFLLRYPRSQIASLIGLLQCGRVPFKAFHRRCGSFDFFGMAEVSKFDPMLFNLFDVGTSELNVFLFGDSMEMVNHLDS